MAINSRSVVTVPRTATVMEAVEIMMTSGIFGMEPETRRFPGDIEGQCKLMFENVRRVMAAAGGSTEDIIKMVVWAKEKTFKNAVNKEWLAMQSGRRDAVFSFIS